MISAYLYLNLISLPDGKNLQVKRLFSWNYAGNANRDKVKNPGSTGKILLKKPSEVMSLNF